MFHTIVSIKNDGHYFCRAGGNRPDGLNEPVTFSRTNMIFEACGFNNPSMNTNAPISLQVLGELYGYQRYIMPKGPFTGFPFEFQEVK